MTPILFGIAICLNVVLVCIVLAKLARDDFEKRFPPISDAEFLARCRPGTDPEVALKVRRIVADHFAVEYERVYPSTTFIEDIERWINGCLSRVIADPSRGVGAAEDPRPCANWLPRPATTSAGNSMTWPAA